MITTLRFINKKHATAIIIMVAVVVLSLIAVFTTDAVYADLNGNTDTKKALIGNGYSGEGKGTEDDPYLVDSISDLKAIASVVNNGSSLYGEFIELRNDIDLPSDWIPIGALRKGASNTGNGKNICPFSGSFRGNGRTVTSALGGKPLFGYVRQASISDLNISGDEISGNGLIFNYSTDYGEDGDSSQIPETAVIRGVTIKSGTKIRGSGFVGGYASGGNIVDIINCKIEEGVLVGFGGNREKIGSFGGDFNGSVIGCYSAADVYGTNFVGGIIGCKGSSMGQVNIRDCTFAGKVVASGRYAGGIAGGGYGGSLGYGYETAPNGIPVSINGCLSSGEIHANDVAGGILGFETTVQPWDYNGFVRGNLFTGAVSAEEPGTIGAIVGLFRGLCKSDVIKDNYYLDSCGADRGIGRVNYLDTSYANHETYYGDNYFNSGSGNIPVYEGLNDVYKDNLKPGYNRSDDPLGADRALVARPVISDGLRDGTVVDLLNNAEGTSSSWIQGNDRPEIDVKRTVIGLSVKSGYKAEYHIDEAFDPSTVEFRVRWSDGKQDIVSGNSEDITIKGFDSSERKLLKLTASYKGSVDTSFNVKIVYEDDGEPIRISFALLGDERHGTDNEVVHFRVGGNLVEWIYEPDYEAGKNWTVGELIFHIIAGKGLGIKSTSDSQYGSRYISGIQSPVTNEFLMEKDNGPNSGWMYAVNGIEPGVGVDLLFLEDGDEVILFYSDDYSLEQSTHGGQEAVNRAAAQIVMNSIYELPDEGSITLVEKDAVNRARAAYEALTSDQKALVSSKALNRLNSLEKKITALEEEKKAEEEKARKAKEEAEKKKAEEAKKAEEERIKAITSVTVNSKNVSAKAVASALAKAGGSPEYITKIVLGKKVKKIGKKAFAKYKNAKKLVVKTKKLKKKAVKASLKGSRIKTIQVKVGSKKVNRKFIKRYRKFFTKKISGRKVKVS